MTRKIRKGADSRQAGMVPDLTDRADLDKRKARRRVSTNIFESFKPVVELGWKDRRRNDSQR